MTSSPGAGPEGSGAGGRTQVTGPGPLVLLGCAGLVLGWAARGVAIRNGWATPTPSLTAIGAIWFVAAVTAGTSWLTWRTVQRERRRLTAQQGLARLVLGKTIDRLGAFVLGGALGMVVSVLGVSGDNAERIALRAAIAALGAAAALASGLVLEHACRVPPDDAADLP